MALILELACRGLVGSGWHHQNSLTWPDLPSRALFSRCPGHKHYGSFQTDKTVGRDQFVVKHYAGDVIYTIDGFVDTNNDLLFRDLKSSMMTSSSDVVKACFPAAELDSKKRPATAGTQFRSSMASLSHLDLNNAPYVLCVVKYIGLVSLKRPATAGTQFRSSMASQSQLLTSRPLTWLCALCFGWG